MWLAALAFHWSLLMILLRHLRLLVEHVPRFVNGLERVDGFFQIGAPQVYPSDAGSAWRAGVFDRQTLSRSAGSLHLPVYGLLRPLLLLGIAVSGVLMRYFVRADISGVKQFALGVAAFRPIVSKTLGPVFLVHLLLVCSLAAYFPFSKLVHVGGVFLSPDAQPGQQQPQQAACESLELSGKDPQLRGVGRGVPRKNAGAGFPLEADDARTTAAD